MLLMGTLGDIVVNLYLLPFIQYGFFGPYGHLTLFMVFWSSWPLNFFHGFFGPYDLKTQTSGWIDSGQISQCGCCAAAVLNHEDLLVLTLTFPPSFFTSCLREVLFFSGLVVHCKKSNMGSIQWLIGCRLEAIVC